MIVADFSEVKQLARDLERAGPRAERETAHVLRVGATKIKKGMRSDFRNHYHLPDVWRAINFDPIDDGYEIGVDKNNDQGELGNILAYGDGVHGPYLDHTAALHREAPIAEQKIADAGEQAPLGRGR